MPKKTHRAKTQRRTQPLSAIWLREVAQGIRNALLQDRDAENGDCEPVANALVNELVRRGFDAYSVFGNWRGHPHQWVVVSGYSIDPTRDQFRYYVDQEEEDALEDEPVLVWRGPHPDYGNARW